MNIGTKVRTLRKEKGYTLKEVSGLTGLSISFISEIEREERNPSLSNLEKIAYALGSTSDVILSGVSFNPNEIEEQFPNVMKVLRRDGKKITPERERFIAKIIQSAIEEE